jgi:hypothetical protein
MTVEPTRNLRHIAPTGLAGLAVAAMAATLVIFGPTEAGAATATVDLATAGSFSALAYSTVTNTGPSVLGQSLGVSPGSAQTGFPPGIVGGAIHLGDAVAAQAQSDLTAAYNDAAGRTPFTSHASELGGDTLTPGVYRIGAAQVTGQLTLNAQGNPQSVFIFQIDSTLVTAANSSVVFINGSAACNVFWQVGSSATIGTGTAFIGNIMAQASISMKTGATLQGRALARTGAVTLDTNAIFQPVCTAPTPTPTPTATVTATPTPTPTVTATPTPTPTPTVTVTPTPTPTVTVTPTPTPTVTVTPTPTPTVTVTPTPTPTVTPTPTPTVTVTPTPTATPTAPGGYGSPTPKPTGPGYGYGPTPTPTGPAYGYHHPTPTRHVDGHPHRHGGGHRHRHHTAGWILGDESRAVLGIARHAVADV